MNPDRVTMVHLERACQRMWKAFDRYEAKVDLNNRAPTDHLFRAYLRHAQAVQDMAAALGLRQPPAIPC